jgi:5'-nucleotidase
MKFWIYKIWHLFVLGLLSMQFSCDKPATEYVLIQLNDTYEMAPHQPQSPGGLARAATIIKSLRAENPNTFVFHAGDFLTPSSYSGFKDSAGNLLEGRQMVEVMNAVGIDYATFGNHEFDISEAGLLLRLDELEARLVSNNCFHSTGDSAKPFTQRGHIIVQAAILPDHTAQGFSIGLTATTLPYNRKPFVKYEDPRELTQKAVNLLSSKCDAVVLLSHQSREEDSLFAAAISGISLIMGGHEHFSFMDTVQNTYVAKADANARSIWVHRITLIKGEKPSLKSTLIPIDSEIAEDIEVKAVVERWQRFAQQALAEQVAQAEKVVAFVNRSLDARENSLRRNQTNLGQMVAEAAQNGFANADAAFVNSGSIRYDEIIKGEIRGADIYKLLPFGGKIALLEMRGKEVISLFEAGKAGVGTGAYLQYSGIKWNSGQLYIGNQPVEADQIYRIAVTAYMASGKEKGMAFLGDIKSEMPDSLNDIHLVNDIRILLTKYLGEKFPPL